jgi:hypothetical protein
MVNVAMECSNKGGKTLDAAWFDLEMVDKGEVFFMNVVFGRWKGGRQIARQGREANGMCQSGGRLRAMACQRRRKKDTHTSKWLMRTSMHRLGVHQVEGEWGKKVGGSKQKLEEEEERQPVALPRKHPNAHCTIMNSSLLLYTAVLTSISFPWCGIML